VNSESVGESFLKLDVESAVQINICAFSVVKQKCKIFSFSHTEE